MADEAAAEAAREGTDAWARWRAVAAGDRSRMDLSHADLTSVHLRGADLSQVNLSDANLLRANLADANLFAADLSGADLSHADLSGANLTQASMPGAYLVGANLSRAELIGANLSYVDFRDIAHPSPADLSGANLSEAKLATADLSRANLTLATLSGADLEMARLSGANLYRATLTGARLFRAVLSNANLTAADLSGADLTSADLTGAIFVSTQLAGSTLVECSVYGVSVWDTDLTRTIQRDLLISAPGEADLQTDNLQVAQFLHLLLKNAEVRGVVDTLTTKTVLLLGRFTPERKIVLAALRDALRKRGLVPILFDFEGPRSRDITETVSTLAHLARFVIADLTDPRSIPQELTRIVPNLPSLAVQPIIHASQEPWAMFPDLRRYPWVLPPYRYESIEELLGALDAKVIAPAEIKVRELRREPS